ncbi:MAG TPA: abortive infection system antitoxin AbiGi family protein [Pyrinomonadaceae bacterium]|nr:abortive infection system antitoxin AbiGi family protein [Pyrinomonadaceae bacterium]
MSSSYTSDELFHIVGRASPEDHERNFQTLLKILRTGCVSYPPDFPNTWQLQITFREDRTLLSEDLIVPTITCYCDIRQDHLQIHMKKYGMFGLSFRRDFLIRLGARPVMYVPLFHQDWFASINGRTLIANIEQIYRGFREMLVNPITVRERSHSIGTKPTRSENAIREIDDIITKDFLAFLKPFNSELSDDDPGNYYLEREWRMFGCLRFRPNDVAHLLIKRGYDDQLIKDFPDYAEKLYIVTDEK